MGSAGADPLDRRVRLQVYGRFLSEGRAATVSQIAAALQAEPQAVEAALGRLARDRALVLRPGGSEILMAMPFSAVPTPFVVSVAGRSWWANCAWDALGIPAMLNSDARIRASCGDCGAPLSLTVEAGTAAGDSELIHFAVPAARWWDDIVFT
jgi:hypothetical protein